jgi:hypothetical protein
MFNTRSAASILPCGNKAYWDTFAETNSIAESFTRRYTGSATNTSCCIKALSASCLGLESHLHQSDFLRC